MADALPAASAVVERSLASRRAAAEAEVGRLIEAALSVIQRTGQLEPRVGEIVREAGLHNQAFYRHFRSKHELLAAVLDHGIAVLASYVDHRMAAAETPSDRVEAWLSGVLEQALDPSGADATRPFALARGRLAEVCPDEVRESERRLTALLAHAIEAGRMSGDFLEADAEGDAELLYTLAMGFVERALAANATPSRDDAARLVDFALAGLSRSGGR